MILLCFVSFFDEKRCFFINVGCFCCVLCLFDEKELFL